jgi:site-specific recombinase XerD
MNLRLNSGIVEHKDVDTTMIYTHVFKEVGRVSEVRRMRCESLAKGDFLGTG